MAGFFNFNIEMKCVFLAKSIVSTDPDVNFKCCISADSNVQALKKHEREVKPIQACRVHSGALDELISAINRQVFVVVVFQIQAYSLQVPSSH